MKRLIFLILSISILCSGCASSSQVRELPTDLSTLVPLTSKLGEALSVVSDHSAIKPECTHEQTGYGFDRRSYVLSTCVYSFSSDESLTLYFLSNRLFMSVYEKGGEVYENKLQEIVDRVHNFNP